MNEFQFASTAIELEKITPEIKEQMRQNVIKYGFRQVLTNIEHELKWVEKDGRGAWQGEMELSEQHADTLETMDDQDKFDKGIALYREYLKSQTQSA